MIKDIKERHHGLARDLAGGYRVEDCATKWGFRLEVALYLSTHPLFKDLVRRYRDDKEEPQGDTDGRTGSD